MHKGIEIRQLLSSWYIVNKRDLPWRDTRDPYLIWISEVILQQTRVVQGYDYYLRFTTNYPDVKSLASADEQDILRLWQGLGYYSRARNLHNAAKAIVEQFEGIFPDNYKDILSLKGVGEYTAAAISSFSFKLPYAVVDGNVYRVLSRLYGIDEPIDTGKGKKLFAELAQELLDEKHPDVHNQAVMELGALQCVPVNPICADCPLSELCVAYASGSVSGLPVKQGKTKIKERFFNYLDIRFETNIFLNKRTGNDIWKNLYELPLIETERDLEWEELQELPEWKDIFKKVGVLQINPVSINHKHVLSHRIIYAKFYRVIVENDLFLKNKYTRAEVSELHEYPISRLVEKYFEGRL